VLHLLQGGTVHHRVPPLRGAARNGAVRPSASDECDLEKGGRRGGGGRVGQEGGRTEYGLPAAFLLWCLRSPFLPTHPPTRHPPTLPPGLPASLPPARPPARPLSPCTRLNPSCHPPAAFSPLSTSTTSTYLPLLRFLPRQLHLTQVDTQLQNIQFERKVKTKWIFQRGYSRCQKARRPRLSR